MCIINLAVTVSPTATSLFAFLCINALIFSYQEITFPKMVASCCRFLCYFCRISRHNQGALFDHLSYLLENSSVGLGKFHFHTCLFLSEMQSNSNSCRIYCDALKYNNPSCL